MGVSSYPQLSGQFLVLEILRLHQRPHRVPKQVLVVPVVEAPLELVTIGSKVLGG